MTTAINLSELTAPQLIEELSYEEILQDTLAEFKEKDPVRWSYLSGPKSGKVKL